jgi:hypothetical protein
MSSVGLRERDSRWRITTDGKGNEMAYLGNEIHYEGRFLDGWRNY